MTTVEEHDMKKKNAEEEEEKAGKLEIETAEGKEEGGGEDQENEEKVKKKRGRKPKESEEKKVSKRKVDGEATPAVERPSRERKTVERFSSMTPQSPSAAKPFSIKQGSGTQLKDIPNVFYKLSKRKADENIRHLHSVLFGKKAKATLLKRNISQFSGFVWTDNDEKEKAKVKEKLDRIVKDKLLDFCDILDVPVSKATMKKEEISAKLFEFLESPHATRDVDLAEKEKKKKENKKRKSRIKATASDSATKKKKKSVSENQEKEESESGEDSEEKKATTSEDEQEEKEVEKDENRSDGEEQADSSPEGKATVKKKTGKAVSSTSTAKRGRPSEKQDKSKDSLATGKGKASKKVKEPTKDELHDAVRNILKVVDFNTATLADILKQLGTRFSMDLMHRKVEVKGILEEVINDMTDEEEADD